MLRRLAGGASVILCRQTIGPGRSGSAPLCRTLYIKKKIKQKTNQKRSRCAAGNAFFARKVQSDKDRVKKSKNRLIIKLQAQNTCEKNFQNQNTQK
jgi:hypothetical protein